MSGIHALSGAYAVDALDDSERSRFDRHLENCSECRAEVASFHETTARIVGADLSFAPGTLRESVLTEIRTIRPLPPETTPPVASHRADGGTGLASVIRLDSRRRFAAALVAAAAAVILLGVVVLQPWKQGTTTLADQVMHASDAVSITRSVPGGGEMTLYRSSSMKRAVLVEHGVTAPDSGHVYQLWLRQPGAGMVSAGLVSDTSDTTVLTGDAATAKVAAVSVEPETGSAHPTSAPIVVFALGSGKGAGTT